MKLSISTLVCPNWSWPQIVGAASAHGINGIDPRGLGHEIDVTKLPTFGAELEASMQLLPEHGLEMPCLNTSIALVTPAPERWEMMLAECQRYARLAERSGAKFLRVFGGEVPKGMSRGEGVFTSSCAQTFCSTAVCSLRLAVRFLISSSAAMLQSPARRMRPTESRIPSPIRLKHNTVTEITTPAAMVGTGDCCIYGNAVPSRPYSQVPIA